MSSFDVEGSKPAIMCKEHAEDDMVYIRGKHCSHDSCTRQPGFNVEGRKRAVYCKQHAVSDMVNVVSKHCVNGSSGKLPSFKRRGQQESVVLQAACPERHGKRPRPALHA